MGMHIQSELISKPPIRLSDSKKSKMQGCGKAYQFAYVDYLRTKLRSATLEYGSCIHAATSAFRTAQAFGQVIDPVPVFLSAWDKACESMPMQFSSTMNAEDLRACGELSLKRFVEHWLDLGWVAVMDPDGMPIIEREFMVQLPDNVTYNGIIDSVVRDRQNQVIVLDDKSPASPAMEGFARLSDQLLGYQVLVNAHAQSLGIDQVDGLGFYELVKRKVPKSSRGEGPVIHMDTPSAPRNDEEVGEWVQECLAVADDIRRKRFSRRSWGAFDTKCSLCDYHAYCTVNDASDLEVAEFRRTLPTTDHKQLSLTA